MHGGAALFAALTLIGGVKAVERFSIAEGPQVVFIGSGTVHRFLFGAADGARQIELGVPLGEHGTKFWAFEGTSSDGLRIAAYVYDHRSRSGFEDRVPVIGMTSADVLKQQNDEVTWTECSNDTCGEQYFHANMHPANSEANNFAVVPVAIDVRPNWYVAGCEALRVAPRLAYIDTNAYVFLPPGVECAPITLYLTHKLGGTSLSLDYLAANEIEQNSESCGGRPGAMQGQLCGIRVKEQRNFSLDLQHAIEQEGGSMALGNWALHVDAAKWRMLECEGCRPRDLVLVVPIRNETGWRPPASVCAAIKHLRGKLEISVERFVDFEECGAAVAAEHCRCKLTASGEKLRLRLDNRVRPERRNHEL